MPLLPAYSNLARAVRRMRRSESAPRPTVNVDADVNDNDSDEEPRRDPHSMGYPSSPTGHMAFGSLHWGLLNSVVRIAPKLKVGQWSDNSCVYCIIWFNPEHQRGMMQAREWHATLTMLRPTRDLTDEDKELLGYARQKVFFMWNAVLRNVVEDATRLQLAPPPAELTRSWNFGVQGEWQVAASIMTTTAEHILGGLDFLQLRERRPLHISWR